MPEDAVVAVIFVAQKQGLLHERSVDELLVRVNDGLDGHFTHVLKVAKHQACEHVVGALE